MKRYLPLFVIVVLLFVAVAASFAAEAAKEVAKPKYVGLTACKACHSSDKIGGTEYKDYETDPHAKAFNTLLNDESKAIATKMGIADASKSEKCLKCHVTAYNLKDRQGLKFSYEEGVTCEACHGPGEFYMKMNIMKDKALCLKNGLTVPDAKLCKSCHNEESPTYKPFEFNAKWKAIEHGKKKASAGTAAK
jgi:nitrate/TMAO reductase-like tetraheme cytochrome c subunit